jgi:hypothetical protein
MKPSFILLPLSNEKYSYMLLLDTREIIEYENGKEITKFGDYELFKQYYLKLNQRVCLPDEIEGFFSPNELAKNYLADQYKILNIESHIDYYLAVLQENLSIKIDKYRLGEGTYILKIFKEIREEISYDGSQKYEIPIIILYGEYIRELCPQKKWCVKRDYNVLGIEYFYPTLEDEDIRDYVREMLYNEEDDKIFNFQYLLDMAEIIKNE